MSLRQFLVGAERSDAPPGLVAALAFGVFVTTLAAYAFGVFTISGGIVWIPFHAAVVGTSVCCLLGSLRGGLLSGWLVTYAPLLGYRADHAFFGLSGRSVSEQFSYFVELDGLAVLAVEAVVLGALALGEVARLGVDAARGGVGTPERRKGRDGG